MTGIRQSLCFSTFPSASVPQVSAQASTPPSPHPSYSPPPHQGLHTPSHTFKAKSFLVWLLPGSAFCCLLAASLSLHQSTSLGRALCWNFYGFQQHDDGHSVCFAFSIFNCQLTVDGKAYVLLTAVEENHKKRTCWPSSACRLRRSSSLTTYMTLDLRDSLMGSERSKAFKSKKTFKLKDRWLDFNVTIGKKVHRNYFSLCIQQGLSFKKLPLVKFWAQYQRRIFTIN